MNIRDELAPALKELAAVANMLDCLACAADSYRIQEFGPIDSGVLRMLSDSMSDRVTEIRHALEGPQAAHVVSVMATGCICGRRPE